MAGNPPTIAKPGQLRAFFGGAEKTEKTFHRRVAEPARREEACRGNQAGNNA
jgi:hypothetical protein